MEQARQQDGDSGRQAERLGQEIRLDQRESGNDVVGEIIDDQVEALAAEARQHGLYVNEACERPVNRIDDESDAKPDEHHLDVAGVHRFQRKKREDGTRGGQQVD